MYKIYICYEYHKWTKIILVIRTAFCASEPSMQVLIFFLVKVLRYVLEVVEADIKYPYISYATSIDENKFVVAQIK